MRGKRKASAGDAGGQLPLPGSRDAESASRASSARERRPVDETTTTLSSDEDALSDFVIFLWFLSNVPKSPLDWAGLRFTVEAAAEHHDRFRERFSSDGPCSDGAKNS